MEPGVLDRDLRVEGEHLDQALVTLAEWAPALLVGQVEVADRGTAGPDRHTEKGVHRRVVRGEAGSRRVAGNVRDPVRLPFADDEPKQAATTREWSDRGALRGREPAGDEPFDPTTAVDDAQGGISRVDQLPDTVDDQLQDAVEIQFADDRARCTDEGVDRRLEGRIGVDRLARRGRWIVI